jgi:hypothetical protein
VEIVSAPTFFPNPIDWEKLSASILGLSEEKHHCLLTGDLGSECLEQKTSTHATSAS